MKTLIKILIEPLGLHNPESALENTHFLHLVIAMLNYIYAEFPDQNLATLSNVLLLSVSRKCKHISSEP